MGSEMCIRDRVSCYYEEVTDSNGDVVQSHAIMCEGEGDKACTCSHEK